MGPVVGHYLNLNLDMDPFPHLGVQGGHHKVSGDIRPKHRGPYPHLNIDMDLFPQSRVRGGGHREVYGGPFVPNIGGGILI